MKLIPIIFWQYIYLMEIILFIKIIVTLLMVIFIMKRMSLNTTVYL